jgi:putative CocE/NonD family hydrolase
MGNAAATERNGYREKHRTCSEEGTFLAFWHAEQVGRIVFSYQPNRSYRSRIYLEANVVATLDVTLGKKGWTHVSFRTPLNTIEVRRRPFLIQTVVDGRRSWAALPPRCSFFSAYAPALLCTILPAEDEECPPISAITASGDLIDVKVHLLPDSNARSRSPEAGLRRYEINAPGADLVAWADRHHVVMVQHPAAHSTLVRVGNEHLWPGQLPSIKRETVSVPMRDGVCLATDLYFPVAAGPHPAVLLRTAYGRSLEWAQSRHLARSGFVVAVQDVRGRFDSQGVWEPFVHEGQDGHDAIEWLGTQAWCSGRVGMVGGSYCGYAQWVAAAERPAHLTAIAPAAAPPDPFRNVPYENGVFFLAFALWWNDVVDSCATVDPSGRAFARTLDRDYGAAVRELPVIDLDRRLLGHRCRVWRNWIEHASEDQYWSRANYLDRIGAVQVPVFQQTGWFDGNAIGAKLASMRLPAASADRRRLVIGPWEHIGEARLVLGRDYGPQAVFDLDAAMLAWLQRWLQDRGTPDSPAGSTALFVMGSNQWLEDSEYPFADTQWEHWYLSAYGRRKSLVRGCEPAETTISSFTYDPLDPTPDQGLHEGILTPRRLVPAHRPLRRLRRRGDLLAFESRPLEAAVTILGPMSLVLFAASTAVDTDWHVHLLALAPDAYPSVLAHGKMRARFRHSLSSPEPLKPGRVERYEIDLWHIGITLAAGTKLRLEIASAAFPTFSRNLNTGGHNEMETRCETAVQTIYHGPDYPSRLVLPVIGPERFQRPPQSTPRTTA